ncbi:GNAT family N-acetyltransferase [Streptomyces marincola]|uniref:GNAT family N-acetyltransferase n=1 Tax=Streptomyces marincola TaxID=2878388 RepID=UPI001CF582FE|nr:GNAT family protein [Streptomyces marincola]UCM87779.1 GNAT family N-acetyltransferase [Streptomyces marincola]
MRDCLDRSGHPSAAVRLAPRTGDVAVLPARAGAEHMAEVERLLRAAGFALTTTGDALLVTRRFRADVDLRPLDEHLLSRLLDAAVEDADPREVMPAVAGPAGWTRERRAAFLRFHRTRSLSACPVESTYAVLLAGTAGGPRVVGAARLAPVPEQPLTVEAGLWLRRQVRGEGVGSAVFRQLAGLARAGGAAHMVARTTPENAASQRLLSALCTTVTRHEDAVTARLALGPAWS